MNHIVNAPMLRFETAKKLSIGRIDNGIHIQCGNIALPESCAVGCGVQRTGKLLRDAF
jgi:hypothetical protein